MVSVAWLRAELVQGTTCNKDQLCTGYKPGKSGYVVQLHVQSSIPITEKFSAQDVSKKTRRGTKEIGSNFFQFVFVEKARPTWDGRCFIFVEARKQIVKRKLQV